LPKSSDGGTHSGEDGEESIHQEAKNMRSSIYSSIQIILSLSNGVAHFQPIYQKTGCVHGWLHKLKALEGKVLVAYVRHMKAQPVEINGSS
ncbi:unnamed protein product, partial [Ilex paraguariensis]